MFQSLRNKSVIVTGGAKGIGRGIAEVFLSLGCKVCIIGRDERAGAATAEAMKSHGRLIFCRANVKEKLEIEAAIKTAAEAFGGIDILCANAGIFPQAKLEDMSEQDWDGVFATNLKGMFLGVKSCLDYLKASRAGRIVLTSSITGPITGYPGWSHYAATKAGMLGFMRTAAIELAKFKITINAVLPGNVLTEGVVELGSDYIEKMSAAIPLHRLGSVQEVGYAVAFLSSEEAAFITGQTIIIDGGQTLPESRSALDA